MGIGLAMNTFCLTYAWVGQLELDITSFLHVRISSYYGSINHIRYISIRTNSIYYYIFVIYYIGQ